MTKKTLFFLFPLLCLLLSLAFPAESAQGVKTGLDLALSGALPALFPGLVLSGILSKTISPKSEKAPLILPFILGLICGFPVGAKTVCSFVKDKKIEKEKAEKLLPFVSGASPNFLISFCSIALFTDSRKGLLLYFMQSAILSISFLLFFSKDLFKKEEKTKKASESCHFFSLLPKAISDGMSSFIYISACIIFFSFFISLISSLLSLSPFWKALLSLILELTGGVKSLSLFPQNLAFPLCAFGVGFNGFSVHLQTLGLISEEKLSAKWYFYGKVIFALLFFLFALFLQKLL